MKSPLSRLTKSKRHLSAALGVPFLLSTLGLAQNAPDNAAARNAAPGHTYWKYSNADVVLDLWECPETTVCAKIHWLNPQDPGAIKMAKFLWQQDERHGKKNGTVTESQMQQVCGYPQVFRDMKKVSEGEYAGEGIYHAMIDKPDNPGTKNLVFLHQKGDELVIRTFLKGFWPHKDILGKVKNPPPACLPPVPHLKFH